MRGVVLHDFFSTIGGGEKVALAIASCLDADILTTNIDLGSDFFNGHHICSIGRVPSVPGIKQTTTAARFHISHDFDEYDYIICSGNWAHHAARTTIPAIYYCQDAPVRAFYDLYPDYLHQQHPLMKPVFALWAGIMRRFDQKAISHVTTIVANSRSVQDRVWKYYHRDARVIYPPVDTRQFSYKPAEDFWLSVNRLYPSKRIEIQIDAFSHMPDERLVIVGALASGDHAVQYSHHILSRITECPNISVITQGISDADLADLYSRCKGVICTSSAEAFGMVAIEAMASGKPVIAVDEGGYMETVTSECGVFIKPDYQELISGVRMLSETLEDFRVSSLKRASQYDISLFENNIRTTVRETYEKWSDSA